MDGSMRLGRNETVAFGHNYRIRRINVVPGADLGVRVDFHRTEQYVVLAGEARITRGKDVIQAGPNASVMVPVGVPHRLENTGGDILSVLEVQVGSPFEDDFQNA